MLAVIGDVMLDVDLVGTVERLSPEAPVPVLSDATEVRRPGGAALAALLAAQDAQDAQDARTRDVVLIAPFAEDDAARAVRDLLGERVRVIALPFTGSTPIKTRLRAGSHPIARLDSGGADGEVGDLPVEAIDALRAADAVLVADYGRGAAAAPAVRAALTTLAGGGPGRPPIVWDPHPRGPAPVPGAALVTPNAAEAARFVPSVSGSEPSAVRRRAEDLVERWQAAAVAVTLGPAGALLTFGAGTPSVLPAPPVRAVDTCGAGDCFAAAAAGALADGALPSEAVAAAVAAASAFVAAGGAAALAQGTAQQLTHGLVPPALRSALSPADRVEAVRAAGGTVVATGGCFDLLHAGHIATLEAARRLGDCLVVCLNSDASVRRLKGPSRPLQPAADRVRVLSALRCVDAVVVFDDDTPEAVLRTVRPQIWVKGGDYAGAELPEAAVLAEWGGQAVTVPYVDGRSTTGLVEQARQ